MAHMRNDYGGLAGLVFVVFILIGIALTVLNSCAPTPSAPRDIVANLVNPCTRDKSQCYSIQGLYSKRECPGQRPWFVEASDHTFFMGCQ